MNTLGFFIKPYGASSFVQIGEPQNALDLEIEISFENPEPMSVLNAQRLTFINNEAQLINNWILTGGGIYEAIPLQIFETTSNTKIFDGIIDLTDNENEYTDDMVTVKIANYQLDLFTSLFGSVSFDYLSAPVSYGGATANVLGQTTNNPQFPALGAIIPFPNPDYSNGDFITVAYQNDSVPDYGEAAIMAFAVYQLIIDLKQAYESLVGNTADVAGSAEDIFGFGVGQIAMLCFQVVYIILLLLATIILISNMFSYLVSPVLSKFAVNVPNILNKSCQFFGLNFQSSIFSGYPYNNLCLLPRKGALARNNTFTNTIMSGSVSLSGGGAITGGSVVNNRIEFDDLYNWYHNGGVNPSANTYGIGASGVPEGTPKQLFEDIGKVFNAVPKIIITGGVPTLHFEREEDFWTNPAYRNNSFVLPPVATETPFNRADIFGNPSHPNSKWKTNAHDLPANYNLLWTQDTSDLNTYTYSDGTFIMAQSSVNGITPGNYCLLRGLTTVNIPFAMLKRKNEETFMEKAFYDAITVVNFFLQPIEQLYNAMANAINTVINAINSIAHAINSLLKFFGIKAHIGTITTTLQPLPNVLASTNNFTKTGHAFLENNTTSVPRLFIAGQQQNYSATNLGDWGNRQFNSFTVDSNNKYYLSASYLMANFHYSKLPLTQDPNGNTYFNQWLYFEDIQIPLDSGNFFSLYNYNQVLDNDGNICVITSCKWNPYKGLATINYKRQKQYVKNISQTIIVDGSSTYNSMGQIKNLSYTS